MHNIVRVVNDGLCTGCGTCTGVCPAEAVQMHVSNGLFLPEVDGNCTDCGLCLKCCPGHSVDLKELHSIVFGGQPEDHALGKFTSCYVGHANDERIRRDSSSGGIVTQLLVYALEEGIIDGALVVRMKMDKPLEPEPFIARSREEIISASKSKYCPVATNMALKTLLSEKGRFAVVGLPCHIQGIRRAEQTVEALTEKVALHIGLMCSHTVSFSGTRFLVEKLGLKRENIAEIAYRGHGWPGFMSIKLKDHSSLSVPYVRRWNAYGPIFSCFFFTPRRCLMCPDETNELADISLGDAWLPELKNERDGESIVVSRTKKGDKILDSACYAGAISLKPVECQKVKLSQAEPLKFKKDDIGTRLAIAKASGKKTPNLNLEQDPSHSLFSWIRDSFVFFNVRVSENRISRQLLSYVPFRFIRLYYGVYKLLCYV